MSDRTTATAPALVIMGVTGSGKTTLGEALARAIGVDFVEGDHLHARGSIDKMSRGEPLEERDRAPWLGEIGRRLADSRRYPRGVVISCSALKKAYRERLRVDKRVRFIYLDAKRPLIEHRLATRTGHFMSPALISSQFESLEPPLPAEKDILTLPAEMPIDQLLSTAVRFASM
jgi:gluconokinase